MCKNKYYYTNLITTNKLLYYKYFVDNNIDIQCIISDNNIKLKIHLINGEIIFGEILNCIQFDKNFVIRSINKNNTNVQPILLKYKNDILKYVKKIYKLMNTLIYIVKFKLEYELVNFIIPLNLDKILFYSLLDQTKINKLLELINSNKNNIKLYEYIDFLKLSTCEIKNKFNLHFKKKNYLDKYMCIDLMLPDYINYHNITLLEIEPFVCGKIK